MNRRNYGDSLVNKRALVLCSQEPCDFSRGRFRANSPNQTVNFYNPKENKCLLSISILVQGYGVIWNEENIKPDYGVNSITINKKLDKGIYDANVLMSFSSLDGKTKLNSGNFKTKIIVG